jgi:hypothetical protein
MNIFKKPIEDWVRAVADLELSSDVNRNMLLFPIVQAQEALVEGRDLAQFVEESFREYSKKAERGRRYGWFYAWFDEMSATLRCGFTETERLPFRCKLRLVDDPLVVVTLALKSPYGHGIPWHELRDCDDWEEADEPKEHVLVVFARQVMAN